MVQILSLPLARRKGAARGAGGVRRRAACRDRDQGLGLDGRDPFFSRADATGRDRGLERGAACQIDHPRQHDRHRPAEKAKRGGLMDGVHDMGGMDGFGKVEPEPNEPVFHHRWEGRVLAMSRAIGVFRAWTIDTSRYAIEMFAPAAYLTRSYYERWFYRNQNLLIENGLIDADEVTAGRALRPATNLSRGPFSLADVDKATKRGSYGRP